jgi:hypothetical protein
MLGIHTFLFLGTIIKKYNINRRKQTGEPYKIRIPKS